MAKYLEFIFIVCGFSVGKPVFNINIFNIPKQRILKIQGIYYVYEEWFFISGNVGVNELLSSLIECVEVFTEHQRVEIREEAERAEREMVKLEQDLAYRESLEADRWVEKSLFWQDWLSDTDKR